MDITNSIITEDGKDYLITYIGKINNSTVDANALFTDLQDLLDIIIKKYNNKHKTKNTYIAKGYGANLQSLLNRYSGDYFSPSFMKGYQINPALNLMQNFFTEQANDATAIGNTFHAIMEDYYNLDKEQRSRDKLWEIKKNHLLDGQDETILDEYILGYINSKDYLHPRTPLDDTQLDCVTEHSGRINNLYVKSIGYTIPCAVSYVADRIDYRKEGTVILDYKTGHPTAEAATFEGYLGSMLLYKWAMEQELNTTIDKGFLICPGNKKPYIELDYSIENEKLLAEQIDLFYKNFMKDKRSRIYTFTNEGYFTTDDAKKYQETMNDNLIWYAKLPIKVYIGEHSDSVF